MIRLVIRIVIKGSSISKDDRSCLYVPPGQYERARNSSGKFKIEEIMEKVLKHIEVTFEAMIEMGSDVSSVSVLVDSKSTSIKQLMNQMIQFSTIINPKKCCTLPHEAVQNSRNNGSCMTITTSTGKILPEAYLMVQKKVDDVDDEFEIFNGVYKMNETSAMFEKRESIADRNVEEKESTKVKDNRVVNK